MTVVTPAIAQTGWLEIPAALDGATDNTVGTLYDGSTRNYSFLYDHTTYASLWVAYPLAPSDIEGSLKHSSWAKCDLVDADKQVDISKSYGVSYPTTNYDSNLYARGHQIPDADRDNTSATMLSQTYLSVNSTPQIQNGFNGGIWSSLENAIRTEVEDYKDTVYITTGPVFQTVDGKGKEEVTYITNQGDSKSVPVPNYYYKVVLKVKGNSASAIGFWFEHKEYSDSYTNYAVSVDQIEEWTGLNFFVNLSDDLENAAESNSSWTSFQGF